MSDDLLGFLLGALDGDEQRRIEKRLEKDEKLRAELRRVERSLDVLRGDHEIIPPPRELAARTCTFVAAHSAQGTVTPATWLSTRPEPPQDSGGAWSLSDLVVAAGIFFAVACLFFPALTNSRLHTRLLKCQYNLSQLGNALINYSDLTGGSFPEIPAHGNAGVAGIYAVKLSERNLLRDPGIVICPADELRSGSLRFLIPSLKEVEAAAGPELRVLQQDMGGSYAYGLGYEQNGELRPLRNRGRRYFVIMADAPVSAGMSSRGRHDAGHNVLFEDGHVVFLKSPFRPGSRQDNIFVSDRGLVEAGRHEDDAVVAPSAARPLVRPVSLPDKN